MSEIQSHVEHLDPANDLEVLLVAAQAKELPIDEILRALVASELFIVSTEVVPSGAKGLNPLLFDRGGVPMAAVFTDQRRVARFASSVKAVFRMVGREVIRNIPKGYGVVVNPGFDAGLELLPDGVERVRSTFC